jgi:hypothetical protein
VYEADDPAVKLADNQAGGFKSDSAECMGIELACA